VFIVLLVVERFSRIALKVLSQISDSESRFTNWKASVYRSTWLDPDLLHMKSDLHPLLILFSAFLLLSSPAPAQSGFVQIDSALIYYETEGNGPPVVLVHGRTLNLRVWDDQVPAFRQSFKVICYDRRGFGRSTGLPNRYTDPSDLAALLDKLGVAKAHLVGMSQGGSVATSFAIEYPERVLSLVLQGSSLEGFNLPWSGPDRVSREEFKKVIQEKGIVAFRKEWINHPLMEIPPEKSAAQDRLRTILESYSGADLLNPAPPPVGRAPDVLRLNEIKAPTLILIGAGEVPYLRIVADALSYAIPGAKKAVIPGGGHLINMIEPESYNQVVMNFLKSVETK